MTCHMSGKGQDRSKMDRQHQAGCPDMDPILHDVPCVTDNPNRWPLEL